VQDWVRQATSRPATLRETVLAAGAACALCSFALTAAQLAQPNEPRDHAGPQASLAASPRPAGLDAHSFGATPVERRIETLRTRLLIDTGPPPEWERFADVLRINTQLLDAVVTRGPQGLPASAVEVVRAQADIAGTRAHTLRQLLAALEPLYEVMTPEQRRAADRVIRAGVRPGGTPG
jgi:hypothetical protein